jgi:tetratricopeptide (TPR) repeat protein
MRTLTLILCLVCGLTGAQSPLDKATALFKDKKYTEAKKLLEPVKEGDKDYALAQYYLGRIAFDEARLDDAEDFLEAAIEANDKVADYHYWMGNTLGRIAQSSNMLKQGMLAPQIKSEFERTVELDPSNVNAYHMLIGFYTQAPGFMGGSLEKAHQCADNMKKIKLAEGCRAKADVYVSEKKMDEAEKEYKNAVKADEVYFPVLVQFYTNQKKYGSAFTMLEEGLKKTPDNMSLIYQFGRTSAISGERLSQGEEYLKKYLLHKPKEGQPSLAGANMRLGQIMEKKPDKAEAKKYFQTAVQLDPNLKEAKEGLARMK